MMRHTSGPSARAMILIAASLCGCREDQDGNDGGLALLDASVPSVGLLDAETDQEDASSRARDDEPDSRTRPFRPEELPFSSATLAALRVPEGFRVGVFASELGNARMLAVASDGSVYVTRPQQGDVLRLRDVDHDGCADERTTVVHEMPGVHGIAIHDGELYLADVTRVVAGKLNESGELGELRVIDEGMPADGPQAFRSLGIGPDGEPYVGISAACEACVNGDAEHATILRLSNDGAAREVFATGLRRTEGFAWHPATHALWATDQASDWRGYDTPPDELNVIERGVDYGWPYCFGDGRVDGVIADPPDETKESYCGRTRAPLLLFPADSTPVAVLFYAGSAFPSAYRGDAFVALHGAWNRSHAGGGYEVARVRFADGKPLRSESFFTGFLTDDGRAERGRVAGLALDREGALLVSEDRNGVVYRISYPSSVDPHEDGGTEDAR